MHHDGACCSGEDHDQGGPVQVGAENCDPNDGDRQRDRNHNESDTKETDRDGHDKPESVNN
jgi:hypothetical protein